MYIHSIVAKRPKNIITNKFLEDLDIGTNESWILERTGIFERRTILPLDYIKQTKNIDPREAINICESNYDLGSQALLEAVSIANISINDIGLIVAGSPSPQMQNPTEAAGIANKLDIKPMCFDVTSGCTNFACQINLLRNCNFNHDYMAIINNDTLTKSVDYSDRNGSVLFGDACTVAILSKNIPSKYYVEDSLFECDPSGFSAVRIPKYGHFSQEGNKVQKFAIQKMSEVYKRLSTNDNSYFLGHQANLLAVKSIVERNNIKNYLYNVDMFGNTAASGAASVLADNFNSFKKEDEIIISVCGVGLAWAGVRIKVA
jgi:3-oxoacyl-[acyl-carrier-protein] synthase-3